MNALEHNADLVVYQRTAKAVKQIKAGQTKIVGQTIRFELKKIRVGGKHTAHQPVDVDFIFGENWDQLGGLWETAITFDIIKKGGGGWFTYPGYPADSKGDHKIRGEDNAKSFFKDSEEARNTLSSLIDKVSGNEQILDDEEVISSLVEGTINESKEE